MLNGSARADFTALLAEYLAAGISLRRSLQAVQDMRAVSRRVSCAAAELSDALEKGLSPGNAFACCRNITFGVRFTDFVDAALSAGTAGSLARAFGFLSEEQQEAQKHLRSAVSAALYPAFVAMLCLASSALFLRLSGADGRAAAVIAVADGIFALAGLAAVCAVLRIFAPPGQLRFMQALSFLLEAGLPLKEALRSVSATDEHAFALFRSVEAGKSPAEAFEAACFDRRVVLLMELASGSGNVAQSAGLAAAYLAERCRRRRECAVRWIEPASVLAVAAYLGVMVQFVLLPYFWHSGGIV